MKNYFGKVMIATTEESGADAIAPDVISRAEIVTKWPILAYLITAAFCMGLSTTCHLCWVKDAKVSRLVTYLDYWGIALLLLGSAYPYISYKYACGPYIVWRYIFTSIIALLTIICMWASIQKDWITPCRRLILFLLFSASCLIPVLLLYFWHDPRYSLDYRFGTYWWPVAANAIGSIIYIQRIPERWSNTGRFDYFGASHQIFHVFVLIAMVLGFREHLALYEERAAFTCPNSAAVPSF